MTGALSMAFVCPRYRPPLAGGAEVLMASWARRLADMGHSVEVLSTCAQDHTNWKNELPKGKTADGKVIVHRFPVKESRDLETWIPLQQKLEMEMTLTDIEENAWIRESVHAPDLYDYLKKNLERYDVIFLAPYLFGVTYEAARISAQKAVLIPCLHDESAARLDIFGKLFKEIRGIFFNANAEMELAKSMHQLSDEHCLVVGMGVEEKFSGNAERFRKKHSIQSPFILYAGRRERGKNVYLLMDYFKGFVRNHETDLQLVFLGSGDLDIDPEIQNRVVDLGFVSESDKMDAYAACTIFCQPSTNESFSIVLLEAWLNQAPALVNGKCTVTKDHIINSTGGLYFRNFYEFCEVLELFLSDEYLRKKMGTNGREYVQNYFTWDKVEERFWHGLKQFGLIT